MNSIPPATILRDQIKDTRAKYAVLLQVCCCIIRRVVGKVKEGLVDHEGLA
jgi:hypothetical protein